MYPNTRYRHKQVSGGEVNISATPLATVFTHDADTTGTLRAKHARLVTATVVEVGHGVDFAVLDVHRNILTQPTDTSLGLGGSGLDRFPLKNPHIL